MDDPRLERELVGLATHESSLESREAALMAEQKDFEDVHASVLACKLAADVRENALDTRATEVVDRERRLAKQQMQEMAAAQKRLEDLQVVHVDFVVHEIDVCCRTDTPHLGEAILEYDRSNH
jgi:hypothetical protein